MRDRKRLLAQRSLLLILAAGGHWLLADYVAGQALRQTHVYEATAEEFLNPERGFYKFTKLTDPAYYDRIRSEGYSIIYGLALLEEFRDRPITQEFLDKLQAGFDAARKHGLKVKFRAAYNYDGGDDAPKSIILGHIKQLQPLLKANKDVLFLMDAGFIGKWGEWHSSANGLETQTNRAEILMAVLDAVPTDRMVSMRYPHQKREIFCGNAESHAVSVTRDNAFDQSDLTRVCHLNDCFLAGPQDWGTYVTKGWPRERELKYIGGESRFVAHGGETCNPSEFSGSKNALSELQALHTDYLNIEFHPQVIQSWRDSGDFAEIQRRLGYRFELKQAKLPTSVRPDGLLPFEFTIENVGFGELFNPRRIEVVLVHNTTGKRLTAELSVDPRFWAGGETHNVTAQLALPASLEEGTYTFGLWMPDIDPALRNDVRYCVRFANNSVWSEATATNVLSRNLVVSAGTAGPSHQVAEFSEVSSADALISPEAVANQPADAAN